LPKKNETITKETKIEIMIFSKKNKFRTREITTKTMILLEKK